MQLDVGVVIALVGAAVSVGVTLGKVAAQAEKIRALEKFRERAGERLETLERKVGYRRAPTTPGSPAGKGGASE